MSILRNVVCIKWGSKYSAEYVNKLYSILQDDLKVDITLEWPPSGIDNIVGLLALWRYYNAVCLEFAGEDDYHGLLRGRGFIAAIGRVDGGLFLERVSIGRSHEIAHRHGTHGQRRQKDEHEHIAAGTSGHLCLR